MLSLMCSSFISSHIHTSRHGRNVTVYVFTVNRIIASTKVITDGCVCVLHGNIFPLIRRLLTVLLSQYDITSSNSNSSKRISNTWLHKKLLLIRADTISTVVLIQAKHCQSRKLLIHEQVEISWKWYLDRRMAHQNETRKWCMLY